MVIILLDGTMKLHSDNIHAQKYNKAYAGARLTAELKYLLQDVESFEPNSKYTIHEVTNMVMVLQTIPAKR